MTSRRTGRAVAAGITVAGVIGLGLVVAPAGAGAAPELPPVAPEELVSSVLTAKPGPWNGTVQLDSALGLPALPDLPQAVNGTSTARIWSGGERRGRVALPSESGERTLVADGTTIWAWDSDTRTVTKRAQEGHRTHPDATPADPTAAAADLLHRLGSTSVISVDGTAEVAGRPAYDLVLAPAPSERTLLRQVRIAVDAQERVPLRLTVLANGSTEPVLELGFTELTFGPQDPALFTFTAPPGATVTEAPQHPDVQRPDTPRSPDTARADRRMVGDGWDTVYIAQRPDQKPEQRAPDRGPQLDQIGTPVSGPWGSGRLITTAVASAIITDDGRIAVGAVPDQVLIEALSR